MTGENDDIDDRIAALLQSDPLPDDAERQLDALLARRPPEDRNVKAPWYHEGLFVARNFQSLDSFGDVLPLSDPPIRR